MTAKHCTYIGMIIGIAFYLIFVRQSLVEAGVGAGTMIVSEFFAVMGAGVGSGIGLALFGKPDDPGDKSK